MLICLELSLLCVLLCTSTSILVIFALCLHLIPSLIVRQFLISDLEKFYINNFTYALIVSVWLSAWFTVCFAYDTTLMLLLYARFH